jgi:hypothetical protein
LRLLVIISSLILGIQAYSQTDRSNARDNYHVPNKYHTFIFSFDYASNSNLLGRVSPETRQPSFSPSIFYISPWEADLTIQGGFTNNSDDSLENYTSELDVMLGYTIRPFKNMTLYPSYTHYIYSNNANELNSMFTEDIRLDADYLYKFVSLGVSTGYFLGKSSTFYFTAHNYYRISIEKFLFRNGTLMLQPGIDANFGNYEYLNLYYLDKLREDNWFYTYLLLNYPRLSRYVVRQLRENPDQTRQEILDDYLEDKAEDHFKLTSVCINLPLFYMIGDFGINLGIYAFIPLEQPDYLTEDAQFFFNVGLSYDLNFR